MKAIYHRCSCTVIVCSTYFNARFLSHFNMACIKLANRRRKVLSYINCFFFVRLNLSHPNASPESHQTKKMIWNFCTGMEFLSYFLLCRGLWVDHERNFNENICQELVLLICINVRDNNILSVNSRCTILVEMINN